MAAPPSLSCLLAIRSFSQISSHAGALPKLCARQHPRRILFLPPIRRDPFLSARPIFPQAVSPRHGQPHSLLAKRPAPSPPAASMRSPFSLGTTSLQRRTGCRRISGTRGLFLFKRHKRPFSSPLACTSLRRVAILASAPRRHFHDGTPQTFFFRQAG